MPKGKGPILTVDALIGDDKGRILVITRGVKPFKGHWCLPGGKVEEGERVEAALEREVMEELGVRIGIRELVGVYSDPERDPRGHFVSVAYHATIIGGELATSNEVDDIRWISRDEIIELGFDHGKILQDWWTKKQGMNGGSVPGRKPQVKKPRMHDHPVDDEELVEQVEDERIEGKRLVEDEAGRGKRAVKAGKITRGSAMAKPMRGSGTKKTGVAARSTGRNTRS
jgi:8-oxo-dGTP diphosphatase